MELQAHVHLVAGFLGLPDPARARDELDAAVAKFTELGLEADASVAAAARLAAALAEGDAAAYKGVIERVGPFYEARPDLPLYGHLPTYRALVALHELDVDAALAGCQEGGRRSRQSGDVLGRLMAITSNDSVNRVAMQLYEREFGHDFVHAVTDEVCQPVVEYGSACDGNQALGCSRRERP